MQEWIVRDRKGREIYLTEERWQHIISHHRILADHLNDVLSTVRAGHRRQDPLTPYKFFHSRRCRTLPGFFNGIVVVVLQRPGNSYVVTAWPEIA